MRLLPPGFRSVALLAAAMLAIGVAQLLALPLRDEPYPTSALAFALLLIGGGGVLAAFIADNIRRGVATDERSARPTAADWLTAAAFAAVAFEAADTWYRTGIFFPARMALLWRGTVGVDRLTEDPLPMMLAGTCLVGLGTIATAALTGALWAWLNARGLLARVPAGAAVKLAGAVPYVAFALVVRALVCRPVAFAAAGRFLALRPDDQLAYRSLLGAAPGFLAASLAIGLSLGRGLWSWLERVRVAEEESESFLTATVRGERAWRTVLRHGVWLRRRRELGALLLGGMAAAALTDVLSSVLIDSFRGAGFPAYPSLGAALFLRGIADGGIPAPLPSAWGTAHVVVIAAALILVLAQAMPLRPRRVTLANGTLRVNARVLASGVPAAHGVATRPAVQWVLGESGVGKSMLLQAWAAQLPDSVLAPQDPDEALPAPLSATDLGAIGGPLLSDLLGRLQDPRMQRRLADPFTPVSSFSRGERQRLMLALALARARTDRGCTLLLDEPTSAQDARRAQALLACVRELLDKESDGSLVITSHDAELLGDAGPRPDDHILWLEAGRAVTANSAGVQRYFAAVERLLDARGFDGAGVAPASGGERVLPAHLEIGGRRHQTARNALVRGGELIVLYGPSGCGKTTLLRSICSGVPRVNIGYVAQDTARAFPQQMPVAEVLGPQRDGAGHWFGEDLPEHALRRSIGALSEGERQRVVLAAEVTRLDRIPDRSALRLLLLDEPFGALDPPAHLRLMDALVEWLRGSKTRSAVLVSHSPVMDLGLARASGVPATEWIMDGEEA
jgi:ABC-type cobalamin/Fe3+-siderophores transport system ATPase subunit